jgi:cytochrome c
MNCQALRPAIVLLFAFGALPAQAGGDAASGKIVFSRKCMPCHDAVSGADKVGPHLSGVAGRTAGTAGSYLGKYSPAMKAAGEAGLVWTKANLTEYLRAPKVMVPGNRMMFAGLKKDADIDNVVAYLRANPKP